MVKVKICGLKDPDIVAFTAEAGADWIGFVLIADSPRHVSLTTMAALVPHCGAALPVALMSDPSDEGLAQIVQAGVGIVQIHGALTPSRLAHIKATFPLDIWVASGVKSETDLAALEAFTQADNFVLDAPRPDNTTQLGGHGSVFDWSILKASTHLPPQWILAGGLTPQNVATAITTTNAEAVDVSSGVESARGVKDTAKIQAFIATSKTTTKF